MFEIEVINYHSAAFMATYTVSTWAEVAKQLTRLAVIPSSVHVRWLGAEATQ